MFGRLSFGSVRGIPITASGSWLFVVFVLIWLTGNHLLDITTASQTSSVFLGALTVLLFFASVVRTSSGTPSRRSARGCASRGSSCGCSVGSPACPRRRARRGEQLRIAIAGPAVTLLITVLFLGGVALLDPSGLEAAVQGDRSDPATAIAFIIGLLNLAVLVLNLLPAYRWMAA